ncbi:MAG: hypothetical protein A2026_14090 [Deltaproteobacteria bacterium RBG_19FT_COMBO_46_12]|nr:MAG: hypothetical protein A2026_14090 [Deltaproteobacteria bacterium RBG_19FT_COMBO_46_12]
MAIPACRLRSRPRAGQAGEICIRVTLLFDILLFKDNRKEGLVPKFFKKIVWFFRKEGLEKPPC